MNDSKNKQENKYSGIGVDAKLGLKPGDIISFMRYNCYYKACVNEILKDGILCSWFGIDDHLNRKVVAFEYIVNAKAN